MTLLQHSRGLGRKFRLIFKGQAYIFSCLTVKLFCDTLSNAKIILHRKCCSW